MQTSHHSRSVRFQQTHHQRRIKRQESNINGVISTTSPRRDSYGHMYNYKGAQTRQRGDFCNYALTYYKQCDLKLQRCNDYKTETPQHWKAWEAIQLNCCEESRRLVHIRRNRLQRWDRSSMKRLLQHEALRSTNTNVANIQLQWHRRGMNHHDDTASMNINVAL